MAVSSGSAPTPVDVVARTLRVELTAARARSGGAAPRVLDVGGGSGAWAVPLAADGCEVTVVDTSANALAVLRSRARQAGVGASVRAVQGDVDSLAETVGDAGADLVLGHGLLEYVDDPVSACRGLAVAVAPGGALSVLVAGRFAAVLSRVVAGRLAEARNLLVDPAGRWGPRDPLQRRMDAEEIRVLLEGDANLAVERVQGHRVLADLVPDGVHEGGYRLGRGSRGARGHRRRDAAAARHGGPDPRAGPPARVTCARAPGGGHRRRAQGRSNDRQGNTPVRVVGPTADSYDDGRASR